MKGIINDARDLSFMRSATLELRTKSQNRKLSIILMEFSYLGNHLSLGHNYEHVGFFYALNVDLDIEEEHTCLHGKVLAHRKNT